MPAKKSFFSRMKADTAVRSMRRPISRPAAFKAPLIISTVIASTGMVAPFGTLFLLLRATAESVPNRVHLGQARLLDTPTAPRQFLFDTPEAVLEFGNSLT